MNFLTNSVADALASAQAAAATDPSNAVGRKLRGLRGKLARLSAPAADESRKPKPEIRNPAPVADSPSPAVTLNGRAIVPERDGPGPSREEKRAAKAKAKERQAAVSLAEQIEQIPDATIAWLLAGRTIPVGLAQARVEFAQWATRNAHHRQWLAAWELFMVAMWPESRKPKAETQTPEPAFVVTTTPVPWQPRPEVAALVAAETRASFAATFGPPPAVPRRPSLAELIRARQAARVEVTA